MSKQLFGVFFRIDKAVFMRNAVIRSSGAYVPSRVLPNSYFDESLGEDVSTWLCGNLHIKERRWCAS